MSGDVQTRIGVSYLDPEVKAAARRYLIGSGNADMLIPLGLVDDPIAAERNQAKAAAQMHGKEPKPLPTPARPGYCPICQNKLPGHGACRRSGRCREAARERGEPASPYLCPVHHVQLRWGKCAECGPDGGVR